MTTQINIRLPQPSIDRLNDLTKKYGSQAKAIIAALENLHTKEIEMETKTYMVITARQNEVGEWVLIDDNGNKAQEGFGYATKKEAMEAAEKLWPSNSVWEGKRTPSGWRIKID
jgi:hypothetical protein